MLYDLYVSGTEMTAVATLHYVNTIELNYPPKLTCLNVYL